MVQTIARLLTAQHFEAMGRAASLSPATLQTTFEQRRFDSLRVNDLKECVRYLRTAFASMRNPYLRLKQRKGELVENLTAALDWDADNPRYPRGLPAGDDDPPSPTANAGSAMTTASPATAQRLASTYTPLAAAPPPTTSYSAPNPYAATLGAAAASGSAAYNPYLLAQQQQQQLAAAQAQQMASNPYAQYLAAPAAGAGAYYAGGAASQYMYASNAAAGYYGQPAAAAAAPTRTPPAYTSAAAAAAAGHQYPASHYRKQTLGTTAGGYGQVPSNALRTSGAAAGMGGGVLTDSDALMQLPAFSANRSPFLIVDSILTRQVVAEGQKISLQIKLSSQQVARIRHAPRLPNGRKQQLAVYMRLFSAATQDHAPWDRTFNVWVNKHFMHIPELKKKSQWKLKGLDIVKPLDISPHVNENTTVEILYQRPADYTGEVFRGIVYFELVRVKETAELFDVLQQRHKAELDAKNKPPAPPLIKKCGVCTKTEDLLRCSRCKSEWYCSAEHQRDHWPQHRLVCQPHVEPPPQPQPQAAASTAPAFGALAQKYNGAAAAAGANGAPQHAQAGYQYPAASASSASGAAAAAKHDDDDDDVQETDALLSLVCPLSIERIKTAARGRACSHGRCFDLETWLTLSHSGGNWQCPICYKALPFTEVVIDDRMNEVLKQFGEDVTQVRQTPDGSFKAVAEKLDGESDSPKAKRHKPDPAAPASAAAGAPAAAAPRESVTLDDDDDHGGAATAAGTEAGAAAAAANGHSNGTASIPTGATAPATASDGAGDAAEQQRRAAATAAAHDAEDLAALAGAAGAAPGAPAAAAAAATNISDSANNASAPSDSQSSTGSPPVPLMSHQYRHTAKRKAPSVAGAPGTGAAAAAASPQPLAAAAAAAPARPPSTGAREVFVIDDDD